MLHVHLSVWPTIPRLPAPRWGFRGFSHQGSIFILLQSHFPTLSLSPPSQSPLFCSPLLLFPPLSISLLLSLFSAPFRPTPFPLPFPFRPPPPSLCCALPFHLSWMPHSVLFLFSGPVSTVLYEKHPSLFYSAKLGPFIPGRGGLKVIKS